MDGLKAARRERRRQDKLQQQSRLYRAKDGPPQLDETQLACSSAELLKYEESAWVRRSFFTIVDADSLFRRICVLAHICDIPRPDDDSKGNALPQTWIYRVVQNR